MNQQLNAYENAYLNEGERAKTTPTRILDESKPLLCSNRIRRNSFSSSSIERDRHDPQHNIPSEIKTLPLVLMFCS